MPSTTVAKADPAIRVRLWIKKDFDVTHVVAGGTREIGRGEVVKVLLRDQHRGAGVINIQERLKV